MKKVVVQERLFNEQGIAYGNGNTIEMEVSEAIKLIALDKVRAVGFSCGVVPDDWEKLEKQSELEKQYDESLFADDAGEEEEEE